MTTLECGKRELSELMETPFRAKVDLVVCAMQLGLARGGLAWLSMRSVRRLLTSSGRIMTSITGSWDLSVQDVTWAVKVLGDRLPWGRNCLVQALVTQARLELAGFPSSLHIGFERDETRRLKGHAWTVTSEGVIVGALRRGEYEGSVVVGD